MTDFLFNLHSGLRWLIVLMTVVAFGWLLLSLLRTGNYTVRTHQVMVTWSSLIGVQWLTGLILFVVLGDFNVTHRWEHLVTTTLALFVAHLYIPFKQRSSRIRYQAGLVFILLTLALIYVGVARLPQGWGTS